MKNPLHIALALLLAASAHSALATQADDTTITITSKMNGVTPFIKQINLQASDTTTLKSIQFTIAPKPGSVTRALSGTYSASYLTERGDIQTDGEIFLPVYGVYAGFTNTVTLTYNFLDGSSKQDTTTIITPAYTNSCSLDDPTVVQARTKSKALSYDYMLLRGSCPGSPVIMDTDGNIRWISPMPTGINMVVQSAGFFDNAVYTGDGPNLYRQDLDGTVTLVADYSSLGVLNFHHNIDRGKFGIILDADTTDFTECVNYEVDAAGNILKTWNLANIISDAMVAGGDDPSTFVYPAPNDWFHNNAVTYRRSDDSLMVSSRENFMIGLDYSSSTIKWILGDETKHWFQFPSLAKFSLNLGPNTLPPIGQHGVGITTDNDLLLMDNGRNSGFQMPPGINRNMSFPRDYQLNLASNTATDLHVYPGKENVYSQFCGSAYEDAKHNFLVDYAYILVPGGSKAKLLGYDATGAKAFDYEFPGGICDNIYNALPLHLESTRFPAVGPQLLNLSTRAMVGTGEDSLIGGFIVTGTGSKTIILRGIGPSLSDAGVSGALADPAISLYDSKGNLVASNDNWQDGPNADDIAGDRLNPTDPAEAALEATLAPGAYTVVMTGQDGSTGIGLVEAYDAAPLAGSLLGNMSARARVGDGENVLISGLIVGDVDEATVVVRALGPSLPDSITEKLVDPNLTIYDGNGAVVSSNDSWQSDVDAADITTNGLAPTDPAEAALLLNLRAGAYTAIVNGAGGGEGVALLEVYHLN